MPLNSLVCPNCSAHINYAVDIETDVQTVTCRRCKTAVQVAVSDLDPVIRETVQNLVAQRAAERAEQAEYEASLTKEEDSVDVAISRAQGAFTEARDRLYGMVEDIQDLTDTMGIVDQFKVGEDLDDLGSVGVASESEGAVQQDFQTQARGGDLFGSRVAEKVADKLKLTEEERLAATYAKELYTYCKARNIKLIDAISDTEWQTWFISTLKVENDTKSALTRLVQSESFKQKVSALMRRFTR